MLSRGLTNKETTESQTDKNGELEKQIEAFSIQFVCTVLRCILSRVSPSCFTRRNCCTDTNRRVESNWPNQHWPSLPMRHLLYFLFRFLLFYFYCYSASVPWKPINSILRSNFTTWNEETIRILNFDSVGKVTRLNLLGLKKIKFEDQNFLRRSHYRFLDIRNERMKTRQRNKETNQQVNIDWPSF